jgi:ABC-2 type transport system ATP-binding protein
MTIVELNGLTKYYGKAKGIEDVSFTIESGEIFGFIGPNGAGKSTTIRTLLGLLFPTKGSAFLFDQDAIAHGHTLRARIGYLPSEVFYYEKMKVHELLKYSASFYNKDCTKRIVELSEAMELNLNRKIEDLSFGNKKKVGIVQGLLHEPDLIILDEPTSGLDPLMQKKFFEIIAKENQRGATVFFSSHILSEVQHLCHRVAIIRDGSIVRLGDVKSLTQDTYKKVLIRGLVPKSLFTGEGITNLVEDPSYNEATFMYKGDISRLLETLNKGAIDDVLIENPTLEEIFMHYYQ